MISVTEGKTRIERLLCPVHEEPPDRFRNDGDGPARILAILSPAVGEDGYKVEDVSGEEPWASLRGA